MTLVDDVEAFNSYQNDPSRSNASSSNSSMTASHDYIPNSTVPNQPAGVFWAVLNRLLIIGQVVILFLSEIGWPSAFFQKYFPVLGEDFGLGALGVIQCLIGAAILSHHVNDFTLVSAFFLFSIGCLHMLVGLILREKVKPRRSLTAWKERAKDVLPPTVVAGFEKAQEFNGGVHDIPSRLLSIKHVLRDDTGVSKSTTGSTGLRMGFGRQGGLQSDGLPQYVTPPNPAQFYNGTKNYI